MMSSAPFRDRLLAASRAPSGVPRSSFTRIVTSGSGTRPRQDRPRCAATAPPPRPGPGRSAAAEARPARSRCRSSSPAARGRSAARLGDRAGRARGRRDPMQAPPTGRDSASAEPLEGGRESVHQMAPVRGRLPRPLPRFEAIPTNYGNEKLTVFSTANRRFSSGAARMRECRHGPENRQRQAPRVAPSRPACSPPSASPPRPSPSPRPLRGRDADRQPQGRVLPGARRARRRRRGARRGHAGHQDAARPLRHHDAARRLSRAFQRGRARAHDPPRAGGPGAGAGVGCRHAAGLGSRLQARPGGDRRRGCR